MLNAIILTVKGFKTNKKQKINIGLFVFYKKLNIVKKTIGFQQP